MIITKEKLREKYGSMKNKDLAKELGISEVTLCATLERHGIELKGKGKRSFKVEVV